jgi:hypothetical protein
MTAAADFGILEAVIGAGLAAEGPDSMRIVTVMAGGIGSRLVCLARAGMD